VPNDQLAEILGNPNVRQQRILAQEKETILFYN